MSAACSVQAALSLNKDGEMKDLFPLFVIIVVIIANGLKFFMQKKLSSSQSDNAAPPKKKPSPLEEFLQEIAGKIEGKPREVPGWPEKIERPDYMQEMHEFKQGTPQMEHRQQRQAESINSVPPPPPVPISEIALTPSIISAQPARAIPRSTAFKISTKGMSVPGMNVPHTSQAPILRSATGKTTLKLNTRNQLKKALVAQMVFSKPRAYETSFDNTIVS